MPVGPYTGAQSSIGNGVTTVFAYGWKILDQTHIEVKVDGVVKVLGADFTVQGVGSSNGGSVTFLVAPAVGAVVQRARKVPYLRTNDYQANGDFKEETVDGDFDLEEMQVQQLAADIARAFKSPLSVTADQVLTDAQWAARALMMLGFDGAGNFGVFAGLNPLNPVSAYIATLLDDPDAATARATLGAEALNVAILKSIGTTKGDTIGFTGNAAPVRKAIGADGQVTAADSSQADGRVYIDNPSRPNLLVNPNWQIDQFNAGALVTINGAAANGPDGWSGEVIGGGGGVFKLRTLADPDNAALKCLEITCTTIDAAIAAAERYSIFAAVEGYDAAALMAGTAAAQSVTLQFKFKTNVLGTYGVSIANSAKTRSYVSGAIVVADALEHEYSLIVPMDVAGAWLYTNGVGLYLRLTLAGGANFQAVAGAWNAADNYTTAAQCNFMSNIANIAYLKRIQLIPGALVQAYRPADIQKELAKAQRQYWQALQLNNLIVSPSANAWAQGYLFPVTMRAAPTLSSANVAYLNASTIVLDTPSINGFRLGATSGGVGQSQVTADVFANVRLS